jgi:hypothetical protein
LNKRKKKQKKQIKEKANKRIKARMGLEKLHP